jgi:hypothetical protein
VSAGTNNTVGYSAPFYPQSHFCPCCGRYVNGPPSWPQYPPHWGWQGPVWQVFPDNMQPIENGWTLTVAGDSVAVTH